MTLPAERVRRDAALVRAGKGLARTLALGPALALPLLALSLLALAFQALALTLALAALTLLSLTVGTLALAVAALALTLRPLALAAALVLPLSLPLSFGALALPFALPLPLGALALAFVPAPRAALAGPAFGSTLVEAGAARAVEVRAARAARSGAEARAGSETGAAGEGTDAVEAAEALAAQALQATLPPQLGAHQHAVDDAAHHGRAGVAILGEALARAGQKGRDGQGRDQKAFHARSPKIRGGRDARGPRWTGSTVVALSCIACEWLLGIQYRAGGVPRWVRHATVNQEARVLSHFGLVWPSSHAPLCGALLRPPARSARHL